MQGSQITPGKGDCFTYEPARAMRLPKAKDGVAPTNHFKNYQCLHDEAVIVYADFESFQHEVNESRGPNTQVCALLQLDGPREHTNSARPTAGQRPKLARGCRSRVGTHAGRTPPAASHAAPTAAGGGGGGGGICFGLRMVCDRARRLSTCVRLRRAGSSMPCRWHKCAS